MAIDELGLREPRAAFSEVALEVTPEVFFEPAQPESDPLHPNHRRSLKRKVLALAAVALSTVFPFNDSRATDKIVLSHPHSGPLHGDILRVMTANVHGWTGHHGNNLDSLMAAMEKEQPDVVCTQEVFGDNEEFQKLYDAGYNVLFVTTQRYFEWGRFGNAVISRHPLQLDNVLRLQHDSDHPRAALEFEVGTDHGNIRLVNLHLSPNATSSRLQTDALINDLREDFQVGCGDLNQGAPALESSPLSTVVPNVWFNTKVVKAAPDSDRGQIDWVFSTCGKPLTANPRQDDIDSDHYALTQDIDLSYCH